MDASNTNTKKGVKKVKRAMRAGALPVPQRTTIKATWQTPTALETLHWCGKRTVADIYIYIERERERDIYIYTYIYIYISATVRLPHQWSILVILPRMEISDFRLEVGGKSDE